MYQFNLDDHKISKVHFIGIGGVSMSGIAELLYEKGYQVSGSDVIENKYVRHLQSVGIPVMIGQRAENITDQELFVYTDAILPTNPELQAAIATRKPCLTRGQFLGALMQNYPASIAVSGSHGKSTTTSMIADILIRAASPTILLGGSLDEIGGNVLPGNDDFFLAEACEYKGNIRYYYPKLAIVLNVDEDHLDYYKDLDDIVKTFEAYMENIAPDGFGVINIDDPNSQTLPEHVGGTAITYSAKDSSADYYASDVSFDDLGRPSFTVHFPDGASDEVKLGIIGRFNIYNALAAIVACDLFHVDRATIHDGIEAYRSLHRRMEYVGDFHGARVLTDYGHHPVEIRATLAALAEHKKQRLICVFQPYTISRTKTLLHDFGKAFHDADESVITAIQVAREVDTGEFTSPILVREIEQNGDKATYTETFEDVRAYLEETVHPGDIILTTGCGNVDECAQLLVHSNEMDE